MKNLVVYYSWMGSTRAAAEAIAGAVRGDLLELREKDRRKGIWGFLKGGFQASTGRGSRLDIDLPGPAGYDAVFIGTPVWAGKPCAAFNTIMKQWAGKTGDIPVHVFAVMADPRGNDKVGISVQKKLAGAGMKQGAYTWMQGIPPTKEIEEKNRGRLTDAARKWAAGVR
jgi:flavodoxin